MALQTITEHGINFSYDNNRRISSAMSGLITNQGNSTDKKYDYDPDSRKIVMALDIDWCKANVEDNVEISTTSELLAWVKDKITNAISGQTPEDMATQSWVTGYIDGKISDLVGSAPETLDTLGEIAEALENNKNLADITDLLDSKANVEDVYTKTDADAAFQAKGTYLTKHQDISGKANVEDVYTKTDADATFQAKGTYLTEHQSLEGYAKETYVDNKISDLIGTAPETLDTLGEIAAALQNNSTLSEITDAIDTKANISDVESLLAKINVLEDLLASPKYSKYFWYVGTIEPTNEVIPGCSTILSMNSEGWGWHAITDETITELSVVAGQTGDALVQNSNIYIAIPSFLNITKAYNGGLLDDAVTMTVVTLADGVKYNVFVLNGKKVDYIMIQ